MKNKLIKEELRGVVAGGSPFDDDDDPSRETFLTHPAFFKNLNVLRIRGEHVNVNVGSVIHGITDPFRGFNTLFLPKTTPGEGVDPRSVEIKHVGPNAAAA